MAKKLSWRILLYLPAVLIVAAAPLAMLFLSFSVARFPTWPWPGWSLSWYDSFLANTELHAAIWRSTLVGIVAGLISGILGFPAGYGLARIKQSSGVWLASLFTVPVFVPFLLFGLSFLQFSKYLFLSRSLLGVALGHAVLYSPIVVALCFHRCRQLEPEIEYAATELGASDSRIVLQIVGRQIWPTIIAGVSLVFVLSWDEYIVSWFLSGFAKTYPVHVRNLLESTMSPEICSAGVIVGTMSLIIVAIAGFVLTERRAK